MNPLKNGAIRVIKRNDILALQRAIEALPDRVSRGEVAQAIAAVIASSNPKFKRDAFVKTTPQAPKPIAAAIILDPFSADENTRFDAIMDEPD